MSYNDQAQYGGATADFVTGPQMADIAAIQPTYGASTTTSGDSLYGYGSNVSLAYDFGFYSGVNAAPAFTIYDLGGNDTLNCSNFAMGQTIDLRAGHWSNIGGYINNIAIYTGVVIENAFGGSGGDGIIGNDAANKLYGQDGNDQIDGVLASTRSMADSVTIFSRFETSTTSWWKIRGRALTGTICMCPSIHCPITSKISFCTVRPICMRSPTIFPMRSPATTATIRLGLGGSDSIYGYLGNDKLDGGTAGEADTLVGGPGDDIYEVTVHPTS